MIGMALLSLLAGLLLKIFLTGSMVYRKSTTTVALQQACLLASNEIGRELMQSTLGAIREDTANQEYLALASARDASGKVVYSSGNLPLWQQFVCFYVDQPRDHKNLMRQNYLILPPTAVVPSVPATLTAAYFRSLSIPTANTLSPARLVGEGIYAVDVFRAREIRLTLGARDPNLQIKVCVETRILPRN